MLYGLTLCDGATCGNGARVVVLGTFDAEAETAGDALAEMQACGWQVLADGRTLCPKCATDGVDALPVGESLRRLKAILPMGPKGEIDGRL